MNQDHPVVQRLKSIIDAEIITLQQLWHMPLSDIRQNYLPDIVEKMEVPADDIHEASNIVQKLIIEQNARITKNAIAGFKLSIKMVAIMLLASCDEFKSCNEPLLDELRNFVAINAAIQPEQVDEYCKSYELDKIALRTVINMNLNFEEQSGIFKELSDVIYSETRTFRGKEHTINIYE